MIEVDQAKPPIRPRKRRKYPWADMRVGDSFAVPLERGQTLSELQTAVSAAACTYGSRNGTRYSTRQERTGVRVWRVE